MPFKTTGNQLFNDIYYLVIGCFHWKTGFFQQTVVMVYYILNTTGNIRKALNGENIGCAGADPEILKMGGCSMSATMVGQQRIF